MSRGYARICGVDEAGRGPLAGPVVCAAVILRATSIPEGLNDSKTLSPVRRERMLNILLTTAEIAISVVEPPEIDDLNILWASMTGMSRAVRALDADFALIDGNRLPPDLPCEGEAIVKGDAKSLSIAAASIVAKVTRDRLMVEADARYPGYGLAKHKGYPTRAHMEALRALGPTPIHRWSFAPVKKTRA
jgi:ribonuclease HII